jgi:rSAM/selenodomain-associated transferase 1
LSAVLFVFIRLPRNGKVKTRLAQSLGEQSATEFYQICVKSIFREIRQLPENVEKYIFFSDQPDESEKRFLESNGFHHSVQEGEGLGQRLENAFNKVFGEGAQKAVVVASDVPDLSEQIINEAIEALDENDIVIGPCFDGGYYLLGMKEMHHKLFSNISWSTDQVCTQTLASAKKDKLSLHQLQTLIDIDTGTDLRIWSETDKALQPIFSEFLQTLEKDQLGSILNNDISSN